MSLTEAAELAAAEVFSPDRVVSQHEKGKDVVDVMLSDVASGALAANVVNMATRSAMRRDIEKGKRNKYSGICEGDIVQAVSELLEMSRHTDHEDELAEVLETRGARPREAKREPRAVASA